MTQTVRLTWNVALSALLLTSALGGLRAADDRSQRPGQPNIVFLLADDLGYAELGCYGQQKIRTPHLDQMAAEGMRFTQFYSGAPVCAPSRCVLMTGKHLGHAYIPAIPRDTENDLNPWKIEC